MSHLNDTRLWMSFIIPILLVFFGLPCLASKGKVTLAYVQWSSEIASTNLVQAVLQEEMDYQCEIVPMPADEMWQAVAEGEVDGMVSAWLPNTQKQYYEEYGSQCVDLGPNLEGARTGLVVPNITLGRQTAATGLRNKPYIKAESISDLPKYVDKFHHMIVGIDPEAGVMHNAREAIEAYGLDNFRLIEGSEKTMTQALGRAISKQEWIVVTGWVPHWKFARWELKFLDDPKNVFGGEEHINTVVRQGLEEDMPEVYAFLDNFNWEPEDMGQMMVWIHDDGGMYPYEKALRYIRTHQELVQSWLP